MTRWVNFRENHLDEHELQLSDYNFCLYRKHIMQVRVLERYIPLIERAHEILVLIAYAQKILKIPRARGLNVIVNLHLHPCIVYASSEGSGKSGSFNLSRLT